MANMIKQTDCTVVFDQAIYAKAIEIIWQRPVAFDRIVVRLGAFHTAATFLAVTGKRLAGLNDIFIESVIIASGSVSSVLQGRHCNKAVRAHKSDVIYYVV